jgi:hypothetical protein
MWFGVKQRVTKSVRALFVTRIIKPWSSLIGAFSRLGFTGLCGLAMISDLFRNPCVDFAFWPNDVLFADINGLGKTAIRDAAMDVQPLATAAA